MREVIFLFLGNNARFHAWSLNLNRWNGNIRTFEEGMDHLAWSLTLS